MFLHVFTIKRGETCGTHSDVRGTLDNEAVGETIKADGATLLIQVDLLFRQKMGNAAASTKSGDKTR